MECSSSAALLAAQVNPVASVSRLVLLANDLAPRQVSVQSGWAEQASSLEPVDWTKRSEEHLPSAVSCQVSTNWGVFSARPPELRRPIPVREKMREPGPYSQSVRSPVALVSGGLLEGDFVPQSSF
jgi:hypothetical protein